MSPHYQKSGRRRGHSVCRVPGWRGTRAWATHGIQVATAIGSKGTRQWPPWRAAEDEGAFILPCEMEAVSRGRGHTAEVPAV
jgi:hypothetical protein